MSATPYINRHNISALMRGDDWAPLHAAAEGAVPASSRGAAHLVVMVHLANDGRVFQMPGVVQPAQAQRWNAFRPLMRTWVGRMAANHGQMRKMFEHCLGDFHPGTFEVLRHLLLHGADPAWAFEGPGARALVSTLQSGKDGTSLLIEALLPASGRPLPSFAAHQTKDLDVVPARGLATTLVEELPHLDELGSTLRLLRRRGEPAAAQLAGELEAMITQETSSKATFGHLRFEAITHMLEAGFDLTPAAAARLPIYRCSRNRLSALYVHAVARRSRSPKAAQALFGQLQAGGVDIDVADPANQDYTPLCHALQEQHLANARALVRLGARFDRRYADPARQDNTSTLLEVARGLGRQLPAWRELVDEMQALAARRAARATLEQALAGAAHAPKAAT